MLHRASESAQSATALYSVLAPHSRNPGRNSPPPGIESREKVDRDKERERDIESARVGVLSGLQQLLHSGLTGHSCLHLAASTAATTRRGDGELVRQGRKKNQR